MLDVPSQFGPSEPRETEVATKSHGRNGADTLKDLSLRTKILEIYTLHVLPRNEEWQYSRDFICMSDVLDEEKRESFLQTLQSLEDESGRDHDREAEIARKRLAEFERDRGEVEPKRLDDSTTKEEHLSEEIISANDRRVEGEKDYGIDGSPSKEASKLLSNRDKTKGTMLHQVARAALSSNSRSKAAPKRPPATLYKRGIAMTAALQQLILDMTQSASKNPIVLLRTLLFVIGLVMAFSQRDIKERLKNITGNGWDKVKGTVGMGVKVSYI